MKYFIKLAALLSFGTCIAQQQFTVYFDFDIDEANTASAQKLPQWMAQNPEAEIVKIYGYTDSIGHAAYNIDLSQRRAAHVLEQLKSNNISIADSLEIKGFGENFNLSPRHAENRKAVVYYTVPEMAGSLTKATETAKKGDKLRLPGLNFYNYSDVVLPQSQPVLHELLAIMKNNPGLKIEIQGHICCQPTETHEISIKRARAVYNFLIAQGIEQSRLSYRGFASTRPIYPLPERNEAERVANRRVEIEILDL